MVVVAMGCGIGYAFIMKRRWRLGRVVLGAMLIGMAVLMYYVWPEVSWKVAGEKAIGFDVAKGLVYTVKSEEGKHGLRGYDLWSGELWMTVGLKPETSESDFGDVVFAPDATISAADRKKQIAQDWKWSLLPNKRELIGINSNQTSVQLVELATGKLLRKLTFDKKHLISLSDISIGYSRNSEFFAVGDRIMDDIIIWNLTNGEKTGIVAPDKHGFIIHKTLITTEYYHPEIDLVDGEIAYSQSDKTFIYNFIGKKLVLEHPAWSRPRFLDDGQRVIFTPLLIDKEHRPAWYRRGADGTWQQVPVEFASGDEGRHFVSYTDNLLVTDCALTRKTERPEWVPLPTWNWMNKQFGFHGVRRQLQFWDLHSGQLLREFRFFEPATTQFLSLLDRLETRAFVSEDGRWLTREYDGELTVCDTLGQRTVWCWVVVVALAMAGVWVSWPRVLVPLHAPLGVPSRHG